MKLKFNFELLIHDINFDTNIFNNHYDTINLKDQLIKLTQFPNLNILSKYKRSLLTHA